ncbi:MAG: hypothetical protein SX243_22120 [Acidobacteriota bacterium]|nr:hypothetical protein [Acidobacteriota bacterium]
MANTSTPTLTPTASIPAQDGLGELRRLAAEEGWNDLEELAAGLLDPPATADVCIACGPAVDGAAWRSRRSQKLSASSSSVASLDELAQDPAAAWGASKLVILLSCGRLVDAALRAAVEELTVGRPAESWALVYDGAETLEDAGDLDIVERGARQLSPEAHPHLSAAGAGEDSLPEFLAQRLAQDEERLEKWLKGAGADPAALDAWRLRRLLERAEQEVAGDPAPVVPQKPSASHPGAGEAEDRSLSSLRRSLQRSRRRLAERLDVDFRQLRDEVDRALNDLDRDLGTELEDELEGLLDRKSATAEEIEAAVEGRMREAVGRLAETCAERVEKRRRELLDDGRQLLRDVRWNLIEDGDGYPEELLAPLASVRWSEDDLGLDGRLPADPRRDRASASAPSDDLATLLLVASGGAVSAWFSTFLGFAPLLIALSSASGAFGVGWLQRFRRRSGRKQLVVEEAVGQVHVALGRLRDELRRALHDLHGEIRSELNRRWRELEQRLEASEASAPSATTSAATSGATGTQAISERLAGIRRRVFDTSL